MRRRRDGFEGSQETCEESIGSRTRREKGLNEQVSDGIVKMSVLEDSEQVKKDSLRVSAECKV